MRCMIYVIKRKPIQKKSAEKNDGCSSEYFSQHFGLAQSVPFGHRKTHRVSNGEQERWEYEIGWRESMPVCVFEWGICEFTAGCIHDDHKTDRHSSEHIQGQEPLFCCNRHC